MQELLQISVRPKIFENNLYNLNNGDNSYFTNKYCIIHLDSPLVIL